MAILSGPRHRQHVPAFRFAFAPKRRSHAEFKPRHDDTAQVVANQLAKHFVPHGSVRLASGVIAEFDFDRRAPVTIGASRTKATGIHASQLEDGCGQLAVPPPSCASLCLSAKLPSGSPSESSAQLLNST
jgi:hypothetical protein